MKGMVVKRVVLVLMVLILAFAIGAVQAQGPTITTSEAIRWDLAGFEAGSAMVESEEPITVTFEGVAQVRTLDGEVLAEQSLVTDCLPGEEPGTGQCGTAITWEWDPAEFPRVEVEEWSRMCWRTSVYADASCIVRAPPECDLTGAGCMVALDTVSGQTSVPDSCMARLVECGTRQDVDEFWYVKSFTGTKLFGRCLPLLRIGALE